MPSSSEAVTGPESLRERKKARTRAAIRHHALRLFQDQGYTETTVEQIAQAAEVSPSTFFRYFPTKEDVVLRDDYDELMVDAFRKQPPELTPLQALRATIKQVLGNLTPEEAAEQVTRHELAGRVPELRAAWLDEMVRTMRMIAEVVGERVGRSPEDPEVRAFAGAVMGVAMSAMLAPDPAEAIFKPGRVDALLAFLEAGMPL